MRQRAAVLVGVRKTGGLQPLQAVDAGLAAMQGWIDRQPGFRDTAGRARVVTLSDSDDKPVAASDIRKAIREFIRPGTLEQLFVYFAGHGVNVRFSEYWLLSGAPDDPNEAVNVEGSIDLARHCGVPHVVLISDACRTAADSIRSQAVEGSLVFPNPGPDGTPGYVDVFYASMVGRPALEVQDAGAAAEGFKAVYTEVLVRGLSGLEAELVETEDEPPVGRVRPWPLKRHLQREVPRKLRQLNVPAGVSQKPDAVINSEPEAWLAEIEAPGPGTGRAPAVEAPGIDTPATDGLSGGSTPTRRTDRFTVTVRRGIEPPFARVDAAGTAAIAGDATRDGRTRDDMAAVADLSSVAQDAVRAAMGAGAAPTRSRRRTIRSETSDSPENEIFDAMLQQVSRTSPLEDAGLSCGFTIVGGSIIEAACAVARATAKPASGQVRVTMSGQRAASALLVLQDGRGALLPALSGFVAALTYDAEAGELLNVEYEPADAASLNEDLRERLRAAAALRRTLAAAAALGSLRLDGAEDGSALVEQVVALDGLDPSLAMLAAYALHDRRRHDGIAQIAAQQQHALGCRLFDVALLASAPAARGASMASGAPATPEAQLPDDVFPPVPLLARGWSLLGARRIDAPVSLRASDLRKHVTGSPWTLFDGQGVALLRAAIHSKEIR